jgi:hypothetical protein
MTRYQGYQQKPNDELAPPVGVKDSNPGEIVKLEWTATKPHSHSSNPASVPLLGYDRNIR